MKDWKLRIVRDDSADGPEDWPWMVDGYLPARHMGKDSHTDYTEDVSHFATYAMAVEFAALVLHLLRNPAATDEGQQFFFRAEQLVAECQGLVAQ